MGRWLGRLPPALEQALFTLPGLDRALSSLDPDLPGIDPILAARLFADAAFHPARWPAVLEQAEPVAEILSRLQPVYRNKALRLFGTFFHSDGEALRRFPVRGLIERLSAEPFEPTTDPSRALWSFLELAPADQLDAFAAAPAPCFRQLEHAIRRPARALHLCRGLRVLFEELPDLVVAWFLEFPLPLLRMAAELGALHPEQARGVAGECSEHVLFDRLLLRWPLERAARRLLACHLGVRNALPQRLRDYLGDERAIPEFQRARLQHSLERRVNLARLELLRRTAAAAARLERDPAPAREDGRALQSYLDAYYQGGGEEHRRRDPRSMAWWKRHPELDLDRWLAGTRLEHGANRLRPAAGPLEIAAVALRVADFPVAPAVLDPNKQVVVAATDEGGVVAAAILALTIDERLTFWWPPARLSASPEAGTCWRELFDTYAETLARELAREVGHGKVERLVGRS
ncbi:MAG: hypothetical protein HY319_23735 [Armatimonadetes bacterium]|nr:hypothetical protein [Armatimonadota bacterium]